VYGDKRTLTLDETQRPPARVRTDEDRKALLKLVGKGG